MRETEVMRREVQLLALIAQIRVVRQHQEKYRRTRRRAVLRDVVLAEREVDDRIVVILESMVGSGRNAPS